MIVTIHPSTPSGAISAPPSKSMAHRLLICAGLADGTSRITRLAPSQDILATEDCLRALGASVDVSDKVTIVKGSDPCKSAPALFHCRESGSTLRFFIPLCSLSGQEMNMTGSKTLLERPLTVYEEIFGQQGLLLERSDQGLRVAGPLRSGDYTIDGSISSQFISGLLFALPLLEGDSTIRLKPPVESRPYIDMTIDALRLFGVNISWEGRNKLIIPGCQKYASRDVTVPGDWSNAAFFLAMGIEVNGLDLNSLQGDRICTEYFRALDEGCAELDISDCPDLGPVLMAYAALHHGCTLQGTKRLRIKESDRGAVMKQELAKLGVDVRIEDNSIIVSSGVHPPEDVLEGHNDHRIVMALSVICAKTGGTIAGAEAVSKSFPDYFEKLKEIGVSYNAQI